MTGRFFSYSAVVLLSFVLPKMNSVRIFYSTPFLTVGQISALTDAEP